MKVAIIGGGYWGSKHARVLAGIADVDAVLVEQNQDRRAALSASLPLASAHASLDDVLGQVEAAVIATPAGTHHALAMRCLEANVHVLVEKPLATSVEHATELVETAEARGLVLMTGHTFEFNGAVWKLRDIIEQDDFGKVLYLNSARLNLGLYQPDINVVWDLAPHDISIFNYLLRSTPTAVSVWGSSHVGLQEDVAYLQLSYDHLGVTASTHVSWLDPCKVRRTTVVGSNQMAVYDDLMADERIRIYDKGIDGPAARPGELPLSYRIGDVRSPFVNFREPLQVEDEEFIRCVRTGDRPDVDGRNGLEVVRVLCAADEALHSGRRIELGAPVIDLRGRRTPENLPS